MPRWNAEELVRYYHDLVQPHVPEPIFAVGSLQPAGTWGNFALSKLSPGAGMAGRARNNTRAGGLAKTGGMRPRNWHAWRSPRTASTRSA